MSDNLEWNKKNWSDKNRWESEWKAGYAWGGEASVRADFSRFITPYMINMKDPDILEIACGMGRFTKLILEVAGSLHSIDLQEICVDHCKKFFENEKNFSASVTDGKTLPEGSFDMIISYDSLVHADFEVLQHYFSQAQERLRNNGVVIIHHANRPDPTCSRFCVTSDMVKEFIETLPELSLVSQTLFRYSERRFVDCVTVCRKQKINGSEPYSNLFDKTYARNTNEWCSIKGFSQVNVLHPNRIGAPSLSVLERNVPVKDKSNITINASASNASDVNPGALLQIKLIKDGQVLSESELDLPPHKSNETTIPIPGSLETLDIEITVKNRPGSITNQCAGILLQPLQSA